MHVVRRLVAFDDDTVQAVQLQLVKRIAHDGPQGVGADAPGAVAGPGQFDAMRGPPVFPVNIFQHDDTDRITRVRFDDQPQAARVAGIFDIPVFLLLPGDGKSPAHNQLLDCLIVEHGAQKLQVFPFDRPQGHLPAPDVHSFTLPFTAASFAAL